MEPNNLISYINCIRVLENYFHHKNFSISSIIVESLSEKVSGMMAEYYKIIMHAQIGDELITKNFFCKKLIMFHKIQEIMGKVQGAYEKEEFIYKYFIEECRKIPKLNITFAPKCYLTLNHDLFILEELIEQGYTILQSEYDLEHCKTGLKSIAEFHACSIILEETQSKILGKKYCINEHNPDIIFKDSLFRKQDDYLGRHWFKNCLNSVLKVIDFLPKMMLSKEEIKEKLLNYSEKIYEIVTPSEEFRNVCCHGDLSKYNVLFKYEANNPIDCKIVDYQALRYNPPAHDVLNFIYLCTGLKLRQQYLEDLLKFYYEMLKFKLKECDMNISDYISNDEFKSSCDYILPQVIIQKAFYGTMNPVICLFPNIIKDQELYKKYVYEDRSAECIVAYFKSPAFKQLMIDIIGELCAL